MKLMLIGMLARLLVPLCAAGLALVGIWVISPYLWAIFWTGLAFVPLLIAAGLWWRQRIVRDEATRPFVARPEPRPGVTRSLNRPAVAGQVLARSDAPVPGQVEA